MPHMRSLVKSYFTKRPLTSPTPLSIKDVRNKLCSFSDRESVGIEAKVSGNFTLTLLIFFVIYPLSQLMP